MIAKIHHSLLSLFRLLLFLTLTISIVLPQTLSISYCNPMDRIMLEPCCHPAHPDHEDGEASFVNPNCCDEIKLPSQPKEIASKIKVNWDGQYAILQKIAQWHPPITVLQDIHQDLLILGPRGPPPKKIETFLQNCTFLI